MVVDGEAEFAALKLLLPQLRESTGHTIVNPVLAKIPPLAPLPTIARSCVKRLKVLEGTGAQRLIVLMDKETRPECPGALATALAAQLSKFTSVETAVVIKNPMFESWLAADHSSLAAQPGRFKVSRTFVESVEPDKADRENALALLKAVVKGDYDKVEDAKRILSRADVCRIAANSRSFRRLLRMVDHPDYASQSKNA